MKKIFVTGGTGFLGSYILQSLVSNGKYHLKALKRSSSTFDLVNGFADRIEWVEGDLLDVIRLDEHIAGCDLIIHAAAEVVYSRKDHRSMLKNNIEGTSNVVNLAIKNKVAKLIHISSIAALDKKSDTLVDESAVWNQEGYHTQYSYSKYQSELEVWRGFAEGLDGVILNPSIIIGSTNWNKGTGLIFQKVDRGIRFYPVGKTGFVDVRDVTKAVNRCLDLPINHQRFVINGDNVTYYHLLSEIAFQLGVRQPNIPFSKGWRNLATPLSMVAQNIPLLKATISPEIIKNTASQVEYNASKSQEILNLEYRPWKVTIKETADYYLDWKNQDRTHYTIFPMMT